jgi:type VI secretion system protein ImpG
MADITPADFQLFVTPIVNLFERECNVIEIDRRRTRQVLHADRTRPRDFEIYRVTRVEDADIEGPESEVPALFSLGQNRGSGWLTRPSAGRVGRRRTNDAKA